MMVKADRSKNLQLRRWKVLATPLHPARTTKTQASVSLHGIQRVGPAVSIARILWRLHQAQLVLGADSP